MHIYVCACMYVCMPSRLCCPRLLHRIVAEKSTCGGSMAFLWEAHNKGGNHDWSNDWVVGEDHMFGPSRQQYN